MNFLRKLWVAFEAYQQRRADYLILTSLSDRELRDLGIGRSEIRRVLNEK